MSTIDQPSDDSLAYARSLERAEANNQKKSDDPLAAVKDMRLQQLAACRIKTADKLKTKMDKREMEKEQKT